MKFPPPLLYKYRAFDGYAESWVLQNGVFFSSPRRLNDPFDCKANISYVATDEEKIRFLANRSFMRHLRKRERWKLAEQAVSSGMFKLGNQLEQAGCIQEVIDRKGMLCLSEKGDDILMFAHYAAGHTGYCLCYRTEKDFIKAEKVEYKLAYPKIHFYKTSEMEIARIACLTKAEQWKYEQEWRFFTDHEGSYYCEDKSLVGITIGCLMPDKHKKEIVEMNRARKYPAQLFQAMRHPTQYSLEIVPFGS